MSARTSLALLRADLLTQHRDLVRLAELVRSAPAEDLPELLEELAEALDDHNRFEETHLRSFLARLDAWGPERVEALFEHHAEEHRDMDAALRQAKDGEAAARAVDLLVEHIRQEERDVLDPAVLVDGVAYPETSDG